MWPAPEQVNAIAQVARLGGNVATNAEGYAIALDQLDHMTDADLEHLKGLSQLRSLDLSGTQITDAGLEHLSELTQLHVLILWNTAVTDAGLKHLKRLPALRTLGLRGTRITDAGVEHLRM